MNTANLSWRVHLLPYLGHAELYEAFRLNEPWDSEHNTALVDRMPEVYDLDSSDGRTRFRLATGKELVVRPGVKTRFDSAADGIGLTTLAYVVGRERETVWTEPDTLSIDRHHPNESLGIASGEPGFLLMTGGNALSFDKGLHPEKLWALATSAGSERVDERTWLKGRNAVMPPPRLRPGLQRSKGEPPTKKYVSLPRVKTPRRSRRSDAAETTDPIAAQMRSIGFALHAYHDQRGSFPVPTRSKSRDADGYSLLSWRVHLLPFLDQLPLYEKFRLDEPWDSPHNRELIRFMPGVYRSHPRENGKTRFLGLCGPHQMFEADGGLSFRSFVDGTQNTLAVLQAGRDKAVPWTKPADLALDLEKPRRSLGRLDDSVCCLRVDGTVIRLPRKLPDELWAGLATVRGRELIDGETIRRLGSHANGQPLDSLASHHRARRMKMITLAMHNYMDAHRYFPVDRTGKHESGELTPLFSWRVELLPYLEHQALYRQFRRDEPWDSEHNKRLLGYMPDIYRDLDGSCVGDRHADHGAPRPRHAIRANRKEGPTASSVSRWGIADGLGCSSRRAEGGPVTKPADLTFYPNALAKTFSRISPSSGLLVGMADGSVHAVPSSVSLSTLGAMATIAGGEVIDDSWRYGGR